MNETVSDIKVNFKSMIAEEAYHCTVSKAYLSSLSLYHKSKKDNTLKDSDALATADRS